MSKRKKVDPNNPELLQAFADAAERKSKKNRAANAGSLDRRIYATNGVSTVRGGLPGTKR